MSISGHGLIEYRTKGGGMWMAAAQVYFYGDVNVFFLLADPWASRGDPDPDNPKPVVPAKGFPDDISVWTKTEVAWSVPKDDDEPRSITAEEVEGWERIGEPQLDYFLDPDEWCCSTWLTLDEVKEACDRYLSEGCNSKGFRSAELEGMRALMQAYEDVGHHWVTRVILWFR